MGFAVAPLGELKHECRTTVRIGDARVALEDSSSNGGYILVAGVRVAARAEAGGEPEHCQTLYKAPYAYSSCAKELTSAVRAVQGLGIGEPSEGRYKSDNRSLREQLHGGYWERAICSVYGEDSGGE